MTEIDVVYVAVAPKENPEAGLAEKVAPVIKKDLFGTRAIMNSKIPKIVGHYPTLQDAESIAGRLKSLGLVTVVCPGSELFHPAATRFRAHSLELRNGAVTFRDKSGGERVVAPESVFLILRGTLQARVEKDSVSIRAKLDLTATVMTGGIPIMRKVEEKTTQQSTKTEEFVKVYDRTSPEPVVDIVQHDFDYSSLGQKKALSSLENLNIVAAELRGAFPAAIFDARLTRHYGVDVPFASAWDEIEINSKLIYLCHRVLTGPSPLG